MDQIPASQPAPQILSTSALHPALDCHPSGRYAAPSTTAVLSSGTGVCYCGKWAWHYRQWAWPRQEWEWPLFGPAATDILLRPINTLFYLSLHYLCYVQE